MFDYYQVPALLLTVLLLPAFGHLYLRFRDTRTLLWLLAFSFAIVRMLTSYNLGPLTLFDGRHPWVTALGQTSILISSALFLASLSPVSFRVGRFNVLYAIPYTIPLVLCSVLFDGVLRGAQPTGLMFAVILALGLTALVVVFVWSTRKGGSIPLWITAIYCTGGGIFVLWAFTVFGARWSLNLVESLNLVMTAMLLLFVFRRFSPGIVLAVTGFGLWSSSILLTSPLISAPPLVDLYLTRAVILGKVIAAMGMILLVLEDELAKNKAAGERERRARLEMEAYTGLVLSRRRVEDFDRNVPEICKTIAAHSRFSQAVLLLLDASGRYAVAGSAGLDAATVKALDAFAARIPVSGFLAAGSAPAAVGNSQTLQLSFDPWLEPGDDLKRLHFTSALAMPLGGRSVNEGALLLAGLRNPKGAAPDPLRSEDLLPVEMLAARLQAVRSRTTMLEKLIDSEKFAGLGQLAGNVTQQLNNPLTVILGYASLLEEAPGLDAQERRGVDAILTEARRMKATLESLSRISRSQGDTLAAISVSELLADMEQLHRPEFLRRSIEFRMEVAPSLPRILCHAQQLRQAILHCLQFAIEMVDRRGVSEDSEEPRTVRLEATAEGKHVQILVAHSGPGFLHPDRAFDPFAPAQATGETMGLGLSLCATILRENNGHASAVNLEPRGAAIILELQAA